MDAKKVYFDSQKNDVSADGYLDSSRVADGFIRIGIACGYVDTTEIFFRQENILAKVTAAGQIDFFAGENLLASVSVPAGSGGRGCYEDIACKVADGKLLLQFPEYNWVDHYPDCDGPSDRWSARITGYKAPVVFDPETQTATIKEV